MTALEQLEGLTDAWLDDEDAAVVVLTGGADGRFITHFDVDEILRNQERGDSHLRGAGSAAAAPRR